MKLLKIALWLVGGLILLALAAAAIFAATFDPNKYRDDVERLVKERTGRTLQLKGPLEMAFWPSLGARVSGVALSERAADREFLSLASAHASVALLPLLRGEVIVDRVRVSGLKARIVKDKEGRFNFQDLMEPKPGEKPAAKAPEENKPGDSGPVKFDIAGIQIENAAIAYRDLASGQDIALSELNLQTGRIAENAQGEIDFSTALKRNTPPLDARLALNGTYSLKPEAIGVDFTAKLDDSTVKGKVDIARAAQMSYGFDLNIDQIDLDRYLASSEKKQPAAAEKKAGSRKAEDAPVDLAGLKGLNAKGRLQIGALQVQGLKLANLKTEVSAAGGKAEIGPHSASLYEGSLAGALTLDGNTNRVALKETLTNIAVGPLLRDFAEQDRLEGRGNVSLDVATGGKTVNAMKSALAGSAKVHLRDGAIKGINVGELLRKARSALGGSGEGQADAKEKTDFSELSASFAIKNGVAHNEDLELKAPLFRIGGAGDIDIGKSTINYVAKASVVATTQGQGGKELEQLAGLTVPVRLSGPLDGMKYQVDYRAAAGDLAKSRVGGKVKEGIEKRKDQIEDKVRDRLKGLLGR
ncbi:MAG TPA: AsmA family protein [Burkholderiales bacterium]